MKRTAFDELLSAYLDGELSSDERARVEDWLTSSATHRRMFDDLKAIRRELHSLPKQTLDRGFCDRVLAEIQKRGAQGSGEPPLRQLWPTDVVPLRSTFTRP